MITLVSVAHNGLKDMGAVNRNVGVNEYGISKRMCSAYAKYMNKNGIETFLYDIGMVHPHRKEKINFINSKKIDLAVEIHLNSAIVSESNNPSYSSCFYHAGNKFTKNISDNIIKRMKAVSHFSGNGISIGIPCVGFDEKRFWFLTELRTNSILAEPMFISNDEQAEFLLSENGAESVGELIASSVFYSLSGMDKK